MKLPKSYYNWTSVIGTALAAICFFLILFFLAITLVFNEGDSYSGLFAYIVLPAFLILGLLLIPIGMGVKHRRDRKMEEEAGPDWPVVDLNDTRQRNAFAIFIITSIVFLLLSAVGSYEAFHYSESVEFCGTLCHKVMEPENVAYHNSPHARVACVECHVGSGANWYVKSKLSGLYQVYSVTFKKYPQPIHTPIKNLRPARETCEECHWPEKFTPYLSRYEKFFLTDEQNTEWDINLNVKIGSKYSARGLQEGVHWHINPDVKVEYISTDEKREQIPWVRLTNSKTGEVIEYEDEWNPLVRDDSIEYEVRTMDCMDCHNRPSHDYLSPSNFIDSRLASGEIPVELPEIKRLAMEILHAPYQDMDSALMVIEEQVKGFYADNYPDIAEEKASLVDQAIAGMKAGFEENIFPFMQVRWDVYPNHIGHLETAGCARCHDDRHVSVNSDMISRDCNLCHTITAQGPVGSMEYANVNDSLQFKHPVDIDEMWKEMLCMDCHSALY